jgi:hypothetical protein
MVQGLRKREEARDPLEEVELWGWIQAELSFHRLHGTQHTWLETLNRLWRKKLVLRRIDGADIDPATLPLLDRSMLDAWRERWGLLGLTKLVDHPAHARSEPNCGGCPVIVLRWRHRDFLIDGHTRINRWQRDRNYGPHEVIVIGVRTD